MLPEDKDLKLRRVVKKDPRGQWPFEKKIEVVTHYLATGNYRLSAALCGVHENTVEVWKKQPWWKELEKEIRVSRRMEQDSKLSQIVNRTLDVIADRVENGDHVYNQKTGELVRKPVGLRDATAAVNSLMQRQATIEKQNAKETIVENQNSIEEQLKLLASEFAKFNNKQKRLASDIEYKEIEDDAVHDADSKAIRADEDYQSESIFEESRETFKD